MMRSPTPINARAIFSEKQAHFGFTNGPCHKEASKLWAYELEILGGMLVGAEQGFYCPGFNPSLTSYNTSYPPHASKDRPHNNKCLGMGRPCCWNFPLPQAP